MRLTVPDEDSLAGAKKAGSTIERGEETRRSRRARYLNWS